jgi:iron complex outermembrane receptor protein
MDLEQLMTIEIVVAGSKRAQQARDVASFVSIVTAADIRQHGYRTLSAVLQTLPSFYVSYDRNFTQIGVRGFKRSGDYNTRVLLLLNGQRTNDNVYDWGVSRPGIHRRHGYDRSHRDSTRAQRRALWKQCFFSP